MNRNDSLHNRRCACASDGVIAWRESGSSSPACVCLHGCAYALFVLSLALVFMVPSAYAATWPLPTSGLSATLGFHQSYTAGIKSYVHSGIDIPASAGMQISSPLAGTVRFTGAVPSGDSRIGGTQSQKTMNAVSIELDNGRTITLMPFASVQVQAGQHVDEGQPLGTLAATGDISSASPHLHMGYKQGASYLDPMQLFGMASTASPAGSAYEASPSAASPGGTVASSALQGASQGETAPLGDVTGEAAMGASLSTIPSSVEGALEESSAQIESFGTIATGDYELAPTSDGPSFLEPMLGALS